MRNQMPQSELDADCAARIEQILAEGKVIRLPWLANMIVDEHDGPSITGFHNLCAYGHVSQTLRAVVRRYLVHPGDEIDGQLVLPGYSRLQKAYLVERHETGFENEGIHCLVPVAKLSREEMRAKYRSYLRMSRGCERHADEMKRYYVERFPGEAITDEPAVTDEDDEL